MAVFADTNDTQFCDAFIENITQRSNNNTYKFALARFLLDYSNQYPTPSDKVRYRDIAQYFFKYYWLQECKSKLRQGPINQTPLIITIIRQYFDKDVYPQTFSEIQKKESDKINKCIDKITKKCLDDVITRFQKQSPEIFYKFFSIKYRDSANNQRIDPHGGILLNKSALLFFKENFVPLYKTVILEWIRFLEKRNFGTPNLVQKIEGNVAGPYTQNTFKKYLYKFNDSNTCFYCGVVLLPGRNTHVDHVIPFDYIGDTELWNLVLACQRCNCKKSGNLPPSIYIKKLLKRNAEHKQKIPRLQKSLDTLNYDDHDITWHYKNARKHGYPNQPWQITPNTNLKKKIHTRLTYSKNPKILDFSQ